MRETIPVGLREQARWQAGLITREQALRAGLSSNAITSKVVQERWQQVHRGVYATFTGPLTWDARLWAAVLYTGVGARLSHQTAAEFIRLTHLRSPFIHVTIPANRRVIPPQGVIIHISSRASAGWRFPLGIPPHTLAEETVIDLVHAAADLDDVIACVTGAFGRDLTSEERLTREAAARKKLRWRADLDRCYEKYGLIIELDGKQYHPDELKGRDQDRDNHAAATAGSTLSYGWNDVTRKQCDSAAQVYAALTRRGYTGPFKPCSPTCGAMTRPERRAG